MPFVPSSFTFVAAPAITVGFNFVGITTGLGGTIGADEAVGATFILGGTDPSDIGANPSGCLFTYNPNAAFTFVINPTVTIGFDFVEIVKAPGTINGDSTLGETFLIGGIVLKELGGNVNGCLLAPALIPSLPPTYTGVGGGKTPRKCGNWFDERLQDTADWFGVLDWSQTSNKIPRCYTNPESTCDIPLSGKQFRQQGAVNLPPDDGLNYSLLTYDVPSGYTLVITDHIQLYTGNNYEDGSLDLNWRLRIDQWWVKNMGIMNTTRGDLNHLFPIPQFLLVNGGQTLQYYINVSIGAGVRISGGKIIVGVFGWLYTQDDINRDAIKMNPRLVDRYLKSNRAIERTKHVNMGGKTK